MILPQFILSRVSEHEDEDDEKKHIKEDQSAKQEESDFQKALNKYKESGQAPKAAYSLTIRVERALNLPILDMSIRNAAMVSGLGIRI
jgi:hypothetical protein